MEGKNFGYSLKNIPIPTKQNYIKSMIDKTSSFLKRLRWKAHFFDNPAAANSEQRETFGFASEKSPPQIKDLTAFENDMYHMIKNIKFKEFHNSEFQTKLRRDITEMDASNEIYVPADKTTNLYKFSKESYTQMLNNNITSIYKKKTPALRP